MSEARRRLLNRMGIEVWCRRTQVLGGVAVEATAGAAGTVAGVSGQPTEASPVSRGDADRQDTATESTQPAVMRTGDTSALGKRGTATTRAGNSAAPREGDATTVGAAVPTVLRKVDGATAGGGDSATPREEDATTVRGGDSAAPGEGGAASVGTAVPTASGGMDVATVKARDSATSGGIDATTASDVRSAKLGEQEAPFAVTALGLPGVLLVVDAFSRSGEETLAKDVLRAARRDWSAPVAQARFDWPQPGAVGKSAPALGAFVEKQAEDYQAKLVLVVQAAASRLENCPFEFITVPDMSSLIDPRNKQALWRQLQGLAG